MVAMNWLVLNNFMAGKVCRVWMSMLEHTGIFWYGSIWPKLHYLAQRKAAINNKALTSDKKLKGMGYI